jgi:hypothetical protein
MKYSLSILIAFVFLSLAKTSYSRNDDAWTFVCTSSTGENYFLDSTSVKYSDDYLEYWEKAANLPDKNIELRMSKQRLYYEEGKYKTMISFYLSDKEGLYGKNFPFGDKKSSIAPNSVMDTFKDYILEKYGRK